MKTGILSDIHEDVVSLTRTVKALKHEACCEFICLGDIVGYGVPYFDFLGERDANLCIDMVKSLCTHVVAGNHDLHAIGKTPPPGTGFDYPEDWYSLNYHERKEIGDGIVWLYEDSELSPLLTKSSGNYLRSLPFEKIFRQENLSILLTHYFYPNISGTFMKLSYSFQELEPHFQYMKDTGCDISICGHGHPEFLTLIYPDHKTIHPSGIAIPEQYPFIAMVPKIVRGNKVRTAVLFDTDTKVFEVIGV